MGTLKAALFAVLALAMIHAVPGCGDADQAQAGSEEQTAAPEYGSLQFVANGEDFVRDGFVSSDGWSITFRHLYVTISDLTAYQTDPPYDPHSREEIAGEVTVELEGVHTVDLVPGEGGIETALVGFLENVPVGHYNAMSWTMVPAADGPSRGYSIYLDAQAEKGDQSYNVMLGFEDIYHYLAGEYVGDVRKGFVEPGETGELEMTFHLDHLFGDNGLPVDSELNLMAMGFGPFTSLMQEGTVEEDLRSLESKLSQSDYEKLLAILLTLGHTGEGHCSCVVR
ncbi:MAG: hypothetical protein JXA64_02340 [Candidatus Fermentibacteraceae bacterium]|nr:hypothetical protein [Candidatus Fermentibacteraceae bacterium]MBN2607926.1 hypothetical protein [Candidatus Fermentibacteraceae bacterium]